jgi:hypothetical protein
MMGSQKSVAFMDASPNPGKSDAGTMMEARMPRDTVSMLGPFTVDESGRLFPTTEGRFPAFSLRWRDHVVDVALERMQDGHGILAMAVRAGFVGSTADDAPARSQPRREQAFATVRGLAGLVPEGWRMELTADHGVRLLAHLALTMPASAAALLTDVTLVLLTAAPYLDVLGEAGVTPGIAKT